VGRNIVGKYQIYLYFVKSCVRRSIYRYIRSFQYLKYNPNSVSYPANIEGVGGKALGNSGTLFRWDEGQQFVT
jgi:hypothetical protein